MKNLYFKTSLELNNEKVELAKKLSSVSTLKDLVDKALDAYISQQRRHSLADMLGSNFFEGSLKSMRKDRGSSRR